MSALVTLLSGRDVWLRFALLSLLPLGIYLVALVFESRFPGFGPGRIPVWSGQSRAFLPGEFGLAWFVACLWGVAPEWSHRLWVWAASFVLMVVVFVLVRKYLYTPRDYSPEAWRSPSKVYHDVVMYLGFGPIALAVCLPALFADWTPGLAPRLAGLCGLAIWVWGNWWDFTHDETPNNLQHPSTYVAFWVH